MADSNSTQSQSNDRTIAFAAAGHLYTLHTDASAFDVRDHLSARLSQLQAMLTMICGNGFENFDNWSDSIKDNYLWGCSMLADECKELIEHV